MLRATLEKDSIKSTGEALMEVYRKLRPGAPPTVDSAQSHINALFFDPRRYDMSKVGRYKYNKTLSIALRMTGKELARHVVDPMTGEILFEAGAMLTRDK